MRLQPSIRLARTADARRIAVASRDIIEHGLGWRWLPDRIAAHVRAPESCVIMAETNVHGDSVMAGFACMTFGLDEAHLNLLGVAPTWQRRGVGSNLLSWLETSALTAGIGLVRLEVRATTAAAAFYAARGYQATRRRPGYYQGRESAIEMARDLWQPEARSASSS